MSRAESTPVVLQNGKKLAASAARSRAASAAPSVVKTAALARVALGSRARFKQIENSPSSDSRPGNARRPQPDRGSVGVQSRRLKIALPRVATPETCRTRPSPPAGKNGAARAQRRTDGGAATVDRRAPGSFLASHAAARVAGLAANPLSAPSAEPLWSGSVRVDRGRAGDHSDIYQLLLAVFHGPSREEFHAAQDDPAYEPANRLLIKRSGRCVAHVQLVPRTMLFGSLKLPADQLAWLVTLPEFRSQGLAGHLLGAAQRALAADGGMLGMLRTRIPHFFRRSGWAVCGRHSRSRAKARQILAHYSATPELRRQPLNIRLWRHVELPALMRIYAQNTATATGPLERTEAYWRWLLGRKAYDHIIVALNGPDKLELNEATAPIVGYAVIRQNRVVELLSDPAHPTAGPQLLARACADAIERDQHDMILEAPPQDPLHKFLAEAGGQFHHHEADDQEVLMMRLADPALIMRRFAPLLTERWQAAGLGRRCELGLIVGEEKHLLTVSGRGVRWAAGRLGRNYLTCNRAEFTRLVLGHSDPAEAIAQNRLTASTQTALQAASALFPRVPLWRPPWDDLTA